MEEYSILNIIITIAVVIGVLLLIRELVTWYYKINKIVTLLEKNNDLLQAISRKIKPDAKYDNIDSDPWKCPKCEAKNSNETYECTSCGYRLN